ncbi:MAG: hypothetical protein QOF72_2943 [Blastocatellia bacterium]|jgi:hypothetical protein|nr:hypothetical protein [Blastocatellia bacterium]
MRILILDTYYPSFLSSCYLQHPGLAELPYAEQWRMLQDQCFGTADFYSTNLKLLGHEATEIVANSEPLQRQWATEHNASIESEPRWTTSRRKGFMPWLRRASKNDWFHGVLFAQIKHHRPDVLYVQDMNEVSSEFLREAKQYAKIIVGQIACPIKPGMDFKEYDLILSSFPHFVERFKREGLTSEYFRLGFEPAVLDRLRDGNRYGVVFVGSLSASHTARIDFLERVASLVDVDTWGPGGETLKPNSPLRARHHGEAWALDMYQVLHQADIVLNHHIDLAEACANNMRLYEATGVGSMLVTDSKTNLHHIFDPGREVVAYSTADEGAELIGYYLDHAEERKTIANAGQRRTLREHSYFQRMQQLSGILENSLGASG